MNPAVRVSMTLETIPDQRSICIELEGNMLPIYQLLVCDQPMVGRYVQLQLMATTVLNFYEIEVHGY